jgi:hypothetical protein
VLSSLTITPSNLNLFTLDGQVGNITINPGTNVIILGNDGSEGLAGLRQTLHFTLDGTVYNLLDPVTADAPNGVLVGQDPFAVAETEPWTQVLNTTPTVPEPASITLGVIGFGVLGGIFWRRRLG